jgi:3-oxoacyl-(acyl-carrier-protein) synthase
MNENAIHRPKSLYIKRPNIYISGTGVICAAGNSTEEAFKNILTGTRSPKTGPELFNPTFTKPVFECDTSVLSQNIISKNRTLALMHKALNEAIINAQLSIEMLQNYKIGICIGTTVACTLNDINFYSQLRKSEPSIEKTIERYLCGDLSFAAGDMLKLKNPLTISVANACSSGANAISIGYKWLESGLCDIVIAGGADELNEIPYCGFNSLQVMSDEFCLPFDKARKGLNLGEGAGILILETEKTLSSRKLTSPVILKAVSEASDAYHITGPHPQGRGLQLALEKLFKESDTTPEETAYINAHGTATINNDKVESYVFKNYFKRQVAYSSTKYYTGHTLAAAGAIEAAFCVQGIKESIFPGMPEISKPEDIEIPPLTSNIQYNSGNVISTSMAFGGSCTALMFDSVSQETIRKQNRETSLNLQFNIQETSNNIIRTIKANSNIVKVKNLKCISTGIVSHAGFGNKVFIDMYSSKKTNTSVKIGDIEALSIPPETFKIPELKRMRRRSDKLSMSMYLAAKEAIENASLTTNKDIALITLTSFGAYVTTFRFLDGLLDFGFDAPSPTQFSNSVHNAPAFYISSQLNITGPTLSLNGFNHSFSQALNIASSYLNQIDCNNVLLVCSDEICNEYLKILNLWYNSKKSKCSNFPKKWAEYAVAFLLRKDKTDILLPKKHFIEEVNTLFGFSVLKESLAMLVSENL